MQRLVGNWEQRANEACIEANNNEHYSRRTSLRVFGVPYNNNENIKAIITDITKDKLGAQVTADDIEACHCLLPSRQQKPYESIKPPPPPGIIVMFRHRDKRDNVFRNRRQLKGAPTVICEDLPRLNQQTLNHVRLLPNAHQAWSHNGTSYSLSLMTDGVSDHIKLFKTPSLPTTDALMMASRVTKN